MGLGKNFETGNTEIPNSEINNKFDLSDSDEVANLLANEEFSEPKDAGLDDTGLSEEDLIDPLDDIEQENETPVQEEPEEFDDPLRDLDNNLEDNVNQHVVENEEDFNPLEDLDNIDNFSDEENNIKTEEQNNPLNDVEVFDDISESKTNKEINPLEDLEDENDIEGTDKNTVGASDQAIMPDRKDGFDKVVEEQNESIPEHLDINQQSPPNNLEIDKESDNEEHKDEIGEISESQKDPPVENDIGKTDVVSEESTEIKGDFEQNKIESQNEQVVDKNKQSDIDEKKIIENQVGNNADSQNGIDVESRSDFSEKPPTSPESNNYNDFKESKIREVDFNNPIVQEIYNTTNMDSIRKDPEMTSFEEKLFQAADEHESGIGKEKFQELIKTPTSELSKDEIKIVSDINGSIEFPTNETLMSKVISQEAFENYITNGEYSDTVGGCVSRTQDMQDCYSFQDYYNKLGLNYENNPFEDSDKLYVMRYTSSDTEDLMVRGYGGNSIEDIQNVSDALGVDTNSLFLEKPPYLGTANTLDIDSGLGKPEFKPKLNENGKVQFCSIDNGSAIFEYDKNTETEKLSAIRMHDKWYKVRYKDED